MPSLAPSARLGAIIRPVSGDFVAEPACAKPQRLLETAGSQRLLSMHRRTFLTRFIQMFKLFLTHTETMSLRRGSVTIRATKSLRSSSERLPRKHHPLGPTPNHACSSIDGPDIDALAAVDTQAAVDTPDMGNRDGVHAAEGFPYQPSVIALWSLCP